MKDMEVAKLIWLPCCPKNVISVLKSQKNAFLALKLPFLGQTDNHNMLIFVHWFKQILWETGELNAIHLFILFNHCTYFSITPLHSQT